MSDDWERSEEDTRLELAVGRTIMCWVELEMSLTFYLSCLLGTDSFRSRTVWFSYQNFNARRRLLSNLSMTFAAPDADKRLKGLLDRCSKLSGKRNLIAHRQGFYSPSDGKAVFISDEWSNDVGMDFTGRQEFTLENVEGWPHAIRALIKDLMNFLPEYRSQVYASARMHRQPPQEK